MRPFVVGGALVALAAAVNAPVAAQAELGITGSFYSAYVWRGLSLVNKPVFEPDINLSFPLGAASLTVGGWSNIELGAYDGSNDISQGGGRSLNLSEFDPYAEIGFSAGKAALTLGGVGYIYPNDAPGVTTDANTWEVYGKVDLDVPFSPGIAAYYDIDQVKGLYLEGTLSKDIPLGPKALSIGAVAGWSVSQGPNSSKPDEVANFSDDGFTHLDLSASMEFAAGPLSITPTIHVVVAGDEFVKFTKLNSQSDAKLWGGVSIGWGKTFGAKEE